MKELTTEQKANRYDEAIEKLGVILNLNTVKESGTIFVDDVRKIFSELKESEDEKIRMSLIELFKDMEWDDSILHDYNMDKGKTIAWLEKQKSEEINVKALLAADKLAAAEMTGRLKERKDIVGNPQKYGLEKQGTSYTKKDVDDAYLKGVTDTKNEIEKQYEETYQIRKDIATFIFNYRGDIKDRAKWMDYLGIKVSFVEKQGEQKPDDKVEPKFKKE